MTILSNQKKVTENTMVKNVILRNFKLGTYMTLRQKHATLKMPNEDLYRITQVLDK